MIELVRADSNNKDFIKLVKSLDVKKGDFVILSGEDNNYTISVEKA